jgi:hypothetical protein
MTPFGFKHRDTTDWSRSRRSFLKSAAAGVLGMSLGEMLAVEAGAAAGRRGRLAKNVLVVLEQGGMSHIDTWDPKPQIASENRSPYQPIDTNVAGIQFTELLKKTSRVADKLAVVRSMYHPKSGANGHPKGTQYMLSGAHPGGPTEIPDIGSVVGLLLGTSATHLPPYMMVPGNSEQAKESRTGFLPNSWRVFKTGGRNLADADWKVDDLSLANGIDESRFQNRRNLLGHLNGSSLVGDTAAGQSMTSFGEQAAAMLTSSQTKAAFRIDEEPAQVREEYGAGHRGRCYLLGRRLIEAGVRFVTVDVRWPRTDDLPQGTNLNWDHHDFIYSKDTCNLPGAGGGGRGRRGIGTWEMMGSTDQAFAALISDMHQRGLLEETLVCFVTEFGRTPKINKFQGRDHWTSAYSIAFAGAGVPGGQIIGRSDKDGGFVADNPHTPEDYAATLFEKLGIDRSRPLSTASNRPIFIAADGEPISELF